MGLVQVLVNVRQMHVANSTKYNCILPYTVHRIVRIRCFFPITYVDYRTRTSFRDGNVQSHLSAGALTADSQCSTWSIYRWTS